MAVFELSSKKQKDGKRQFTAVLYKLQPPECVVNKVGTNGHWNENGITFIEEYAVKNLDSIKDMSITCDFLDSEHTEISGHGETGEFTKDGLPTFEANIIGHFQSGYVGDYEENGQTQRVVYGTGVIDEMRNANFVQILEENIANGIYPSGSIEILRPIGSETIEYLNGKFEEGRVPVNYLHSGYSLVLNPSDKTAKMIELNSKQNTRNESEEQIMDEKMLSQFVDSIKNTITETNSKNAEFEAQVSELNTKLSEKETEVTELNSKVVSETERADKAEKTIEELNEKIASLEAELMACKQDKKRGELNSAIADFTDEEKAFAQAEIDAFNADPMAVEINSIVDKIYAEIGKKATSDAKAQKASEINSKANETVDIYGDICEVNSTSNDEMSIY